MKARLKRWREQNPEKVKAYTRKRNAALYGLTPEQKQERIAAQGGKCAICGSTEPGGRWNQFCTDHDHETGQVRGELCHDCNAALGGFRDSPSVLRAAITYLETHRGKLSYRTIRG